MSTAHVTLPELPGADPLHEAVLFAFDDRAFPFRNHIEIGLTAAQNPQLVLPPGEPGAHDEIIRFYGTVLRIGEMFHIWYFGSHGPERGIIGQGNGTRSSVMCYATSPDGIHWQKPALGLVEYNGSTANNIVDVPDPGMRPAAAILYEPDDPDPARRYKLAYEATVDGGARFCVAFSADGLRWRLSPHNPVGPFLEMAGIARKAGTYYVTGQGPITAHRPFRSRQLFTFASRDFERWSPCGAVGFERNPDALPAASAADWNHLEEIHLGAALWNRGNVILGIYGQWHGHPTGDRRLVTMDLGLVVSHDGLHYQEPVPDFRFVPAREQPDSPFADHPALMQGQGMANVGDKTYYWYSLWRAARQGTGVRMASWTRDRFGWMRPFKPADALAVSSTLRLSGPVQIAANVSGLGEHTRLRMQLLDAGFAPISGYVATVDTNGLDVPVVWPNGATLTPSLGDLRLRIDFEGVRPEDARLHAVTIRSEEG